MNCPKQKRPPEGRPLSTGSCWLLVLDCHCVGIYGFFAADSFQCVQNPAIFILVTLHCETTLDVAICPGHADEVLFRLTESQQRSKPKCKNRYSNSGTYTPVNILPVRDLRNRASRDRYNLFFLAFHQ